MHCGPGKGPAKGRKSKRVKGNRKKERKGRTEKSWFADREFSKGGELGQRTLGGADPPKKTKTGKTALESENRGENKRNSACRAKFKRKAYGLNRVRGVRRGPVERRQ